jgi:hypothetical protein
VIIHPAYRDSVAHECELTEFCRTHGVPMLEAFDVLHPPGLAVGDVYIDQAHPTNLGHRRLADALAAFILALRDRGGQPAPAPAAKALQDGGEGASAPGARGSNTASHSSS